MPAPRRDDPAASLKESSAVDTTMRFACADADWPGTLEAETGRSTVQNTSKPDSVQVLFMARRASNITVTHLTCIMYAVVMARADHHARRCCASTPDLGQARNELKRTPVWYRCFKSWQREP